MPASQGLWTLLCRGCQQPAALPESEDDGKSLLAMRQFIAAHQGCPDSVAFMFVPPPRSGEHDAPDLHTAQVVSLPGAVDERAAAAR